MNINWWVFTLALIPFVFVAWVKADPFHAIELVKELKRRRILTLAHKTVRQKVNAEYNSYRKKAIREGAPAELINELQNERKEKLIRQLTEKLYWRWISESGSA